MLAEMESATYLWTIRILRTSAIAAVIILVIELVTSSKLWRGSSSIPRRFMLPVVGETIQFLRKPRAFIEEAFAECQTNIYETSVLGQQMIFVRGGENLKKLLLGEGKLVGADFPYPMRKVLTENTIHDVSGKAHVATRRALLSVMTPRHIKQYIPLLYQQCQEVIQDWRKDSSTSFVSAGTTHIAYQMISRLLFGEGFYERTGAELDSSYEALTKGFIAIPINLPFTTFGKALRAKAFLLGKVQEEIKRFRERIEKGIVDESEKACLLYHFLTDEIQLDGVDLAKSLVALLWVGHDTTACVLSRILFFLVQRPDIIDKIREECERVQIWDNDKIVEYQTLMSEMPYLEAVIYEGMRMQHVTYCSVRRVLNPFELEQYTIPKGSLVALCYDASTQMTKVGEGANFDPDRWLQKDTKPDRWQFAPFSGGARQCLGLNLALVELKIFLSVLVKTGNWKLSDPNSVNVQWVDNPVPKPQEDFCLQWMKV